MDRERLGRLGPRMGPIGTITTLALGALGIASYAAGSRVNTFNAFLEQSKSAIGGLIFRDPYSNISTPEGKPYVASIEGTRTYTPEGFVVNQAGDPFRPIAIRESDYIHPRTNQGEDYRNSIQNNNHLPSVIGVGIAGGLGGITLTYALDRVSSKIFEAGVKRDSLGRPITRVNELGQHIPSFQRSATGLVSSILEERIVERVDNGRPKLNPSLGKNFTPLLLGAAVGASYGGIGGALIGASLGSYVGGFLLTKEEIGPKLGKNTGAFLFGAVAASMILSRRQESVSLTYTGPSSGQVLGDIPKPGTSFIRPDTHNSTNPYSQVGQSPPLSLSRASNEYVGGFSASNNNKPILVGGESTRLVIPDYQSSDLYVTKSFGEVTSRPRETNYLDHINPFFFASQVAFGASMGLLAIQQVGKVIGKDYKMGNIPIGRAFNWLGPLNDYDNKVSAWHAQREMGESIVSIGKNLVKGDLNLAVRSTKNLALSSVKFFHNDVILNKGKEVVALGPIALMSYKWIDNYQRSRSSEIAGIQYSTPGSRSYQQGPGHSQAGIVIYEAGPPPGMDPNLISKRSRDLDASRYMQDGYASRVASGIFYDSGSVGEGFMSFLHSASDNSLRGAYYELSTDRTFLELIDRKAVQGGVSVSMGGNVTIDNVQAIEQLVAGLSKFGREGNFGALWGKLVNGAASLAGIEEPYKHKYETGWQDRSLTGTMANAMVWSVAGALIGSTTATTLNKSGRYGFIGGALLGAMVGLTQPTYMDESAIRHTKLAAGRLVGQYTGFMESYATTKGDPIVNAMGGAMVGAGVGALGGYVLSKGRPNTLLNIAGSIGLGTLSGALIGLSRIGQYLSTDSIDITDKTKGLFTGETFQNLKGRDINYILHAKVATATNRQGQGIAYVSTGNVQSMIDNSRGREDQINFGMLIEDQSIVSQINKALSAISGLSPESSLESVSNLPNVILGGKGARSEERIIQHINESKSTIYLTEAYMTSPDIVKALVLKEQQGINVVVLAQNPLGVKAGGNPQASLSALRQLSAAGADVFMTPEGSNILQHSKAIFTEESAFITSHNFSKNSDRHVVELGVLVNDPRAGRAGIQAVLRAIDKFGFKNITTDPLEFREALSQRNSSNVSLSMANAFNLEGSLIVPSNMGASYFYARAIYNTSMRQAGLNHRTVSSDDEGVASSMYKMAYLIKYGRTASSTPISFQAYDKELATAGLGSLLNEYVSIPLGMGRLYKDEIGFIPSILGAIGAQIDKSYLFYVSSKDIPGLNTLLDPLDPSDTFYKERMNPTGLFESTLSFGSSFILTAMGAVGLYLAAGEPLNLITSELMRSNLQAQIDSAIPSDSRSISKFNTIFSKISRQTALGLGEDSLDPNSLRRNLIFSMYEMDGSGSVRPKSDYYSSDNFSLSPYHISSMFRRRAEVLVGGIIKPFLMEVVNPYKQGHDIDYRNKLDELVRELGSPVRLEAVFTKGATDDALSGLFRVRQSAIDIYNSAYIKAQDILSNKDKKLASIKELYTQLSSINRAYRRGEIGLSERERAEMESSLRELREYKKTIRGAELWLSNTTVDTIINDSLYAEPSSKALVGPDGKELGNTRSPEIGKAIAHVQFLIRNAGEERQMSVAKALQSVLDELPLNPFRWRIFASFNGGLLDKETGAKTYRAVGDLFSFEEATQMVRNMVMGSGGIRSIIARNEVVSNTSHLGGLARTSKNALDSLHTFWNLSIKSPIQSLIDLRERSQIVKQLANTTKAFKDMEYQLLSASTNQTKLISFANDINSARLQDHIQKLINDPSIQQEAIDNLERQASSKGLTGKERSQFVRDNLNLEVNTLASRRINPDLDPFTREIGAIDDSVIKALSSLSTLQSSTVLQGRQGSIILASESQHFRSQALGVMSINSQSTLKRRLNRIKPGLGSDPTASITKRKTFTYVAVGMAVASALDSLFNNTTGVSLLTRIMAANRAYREDLDLSVDFNGGPIFGIGGTLGRTVTTGMTLGATYWAAKWMSTSMQDIDGISYGLNNKTISSLIEGGLSLTHVESGRVFSPDMLSNSSERGLFRLEGRIGESNIGINLTREIGESVDNSLFRLNVARLTGNTARNTALWFIGLSLGGRVASNLLSWSVSKSRDYAGSADPIIGTVIGGVAGRLIGKSFGAGVVGSLAGLVTGMNLGNLTGIRLLGLGEKGTEVNPLNFQMAAELNTFRSLIREKGIDKASRLELMAALYAGNYANIFDVLAGRGSRGTTQVIATQSPLSVIQFFMAESIRGQVKDSGGNVIQEGQRHISVGIQSAPILGMSFSIGLPFKIIPGGGVFNLAYNDKNNVLDAISGIQTGVVSSLIGLQVAKLLIHNTNRLGSRLLGKSPEIASPGVVNTMRAGISLVSNIGRELLVATPTRIAYWMQASNLDTLYRISPVLSKSGVSKSINSASEVGSKSIARASTVIPLLMRAMVGGFVGSFIGGTIASVLSPTDQLDREGFISAGQAIGMGIGALALPTYSLARSSISINPKLSRPLTRITRVTKPVLRVFGPSIRKTLPYVGALVVASFLTDSRFGISTNMDDHQGTRMATAVGYAALVGSVISYIGGMGLNAHETVDKWARLTTRSTKGPKIVDQARSWLLDVISKSAEEDVNSILRVIHSNHNEIKALASKSPDSSSMQALKTLSERIERVTSSDQTNLARALTEGTEGITHRELSSLLKKGRSAYLSGRVTPVLFSNRTWRAGLALSAIPIVFSTLVNESNVNKFYNFFDDRDPNRPAIFRGLLNSIGNVIRLVTGTDSTYIEPAGYSGLTSTFRDTRAYTGFGQTLVRGKKLNNPIANPGSRVNKLLKDLDSMFILDAPNAFIQVIAPVGFTFRSGEYGTRTNMYVQFQTPGADISTATYSMASAFAFREAVLGSHDKLLQLQATFRSLNAALRAGNLDARLLRSTAVGVLSLTAMQDSVKKRRKYSTISKQSLDSITLDPLLSGALKERQNRIRSLSFQSYASMGNRMLTEAMENHPLSTKGLIQQVLAGNTKALEVLLRDPFGIVSRNNLITDLKIYQPNRETRALDSSSISYIDSEADILQTPIGLDYYQQSMNKNPLADLISPITTGLWSALGNTVHPIMKWSILISLGGALGWSFLHTLGSLSNNRETSSLIEEVNEFYNSKWYEVETRTGRDGKTYRSMPITAETLRNPVGSQVRVSGKPRLHIKKGATYFEINQSFSESPTFVRNLNEQLYYLQENLNKVTLQFSYSKRDAAFLSLEATLSDDRRIKNLAGHVADQINLATTLDTRQDELVVKRLKSYYSRTLKRYVNKYVETLSSIQIDLPQELEFIESTTGRRVNKVSLISLLSGNNADLDTLARLSTLKGTEAVDALIPYLSKATTGSKEGYVQSLMKQIEDIIETTIKSNISTGKAGSINTNSLLSNGALLDIEDSLKTLTYKVLNELKSGNDSPLYLLRHNLGGLATTPTKDIAAKTTEVLGNIVRNVREGISFSSDYLNSRPSISIGVVGKKRLIDSTGRVVTTSEIAEATNSNKSTYRTNTDGSIEIEFYDSNNTKRRVRTTESTLSTIENMAQSGNTRPISKAARSIVEAKYKKGTKVAWSGALRALEVYSLSTDLLDSLDLLGAFSRAGDSYGGRFTEAQRRNALNEAGMVTVKSVLTTGMMIGLMKVGTIATATGTALMAATGIAISAPAWVVGGLALAGLSLAAAVGYHFLPQSAKKGITDSIGAAWKGSSEMIGSALGFIGNVSNAVAGPRGASAVLGGIGGLLGGALLGVGIASVSLLSLPVLATVGAAAGIGALAGGLSGLLAPELTANLTSSLINTISAIPWIGSMVTKPGSWLSITGAKAAEGPFFVGTASQAIEYEYSRKIEASTDFTGSNTSRQMVSSTLYGNSLINSPLLAKGGDISDLIRPQNMIDPFLDREMKVRGQAYNQSIIGRYMWRTMMSNSSNYRVIRRADEEYKAKQALEAQRVIEESKAIVNKPIQRRNQSGSLLQEVKIASYILEVGNELAKDKEASKNALIISVNSSLIPSTSNAAYVADVIHSSKHKLTNKVTTSQSGAITTNTVVDESRELSEMAQSNVATRSN